MPASCWNAGGSSSTPWGKPAEHEVAIGAVQHGLLYLQHPQDQFAAEAGALG